MDCCQFHGRKLESKVAAVKRGEHVFQVKMCTNRAGGEFTFTHSDMFEPFIYHLETKETLQLLLSKLRTLFNKFYL